MLDSVFGKTLWERRISILWWMLGVAALALLTVAFWPTLRDESGFADIFESLPQGMLALFGVNSVAELLTPAGFISSRLYASVGPILLVVFAISVGTAIVAGEEDRGTMDLLLAQPVSRTRIVLEGAVAMVVLVTILAVTLFTVLLITTPVFDLELSLNGLLAANIGVALLALVYGACALAIGAISGNRAVTLGIATALVVTGWFVNGLAEIVDQLEPVQKVSPFHWFLRGNPLAAGFDVGSLVLLLIVAVAFVGIAVWGFNRRDLTT